MEKMTNYGIYIDYGIFGFLVFLSLLVIAIGIERLWFYSIIRLNDYEDKRELELDLHKRLTLIATIGSNAPYVGLLGTVIGIMLTFSTIGENNIIDTKTIMSGLAMALRATALGLVVAIPSIVFYNLLLRKTEVILTNWDIFTIPYEKTKHNPRLDYNEDTTINQLTKDKKPPAYIYVKNKDISSRIHKAARLQKTHDNLGDIQTKNYDKNQEIQSSNDDLHNSNQNKLQ
ncbi:TonB-system energizer ExbB [Helicobacter muridarum]|uniref:ExbB/TolQ family transport protein n=1 Tax=Helicobacter muridarum TaxID=216 RepID=A0A377PUB1_9HELI|nr:TonB-system energizer ExbB [Helicobacter muridarum]STQ86548.1 ExbB/TolQ family transport protein [Helicobacter muridarum]